MAAKKKPAAKPTRWWATVDGEIPPGDSPSLPELHGTRAEARQRANALNDMHYYPGRFVVRRVEIREV